jgi:hypothetical protein
MATAAIQPQRVAEKFSYHHRVSLDLGSMPTHIFNQARYLSDVVTPRFGHNPYLHVGFEVQFFQSG